MTIVSSSQDNIDAAIAKANNPNLTGKVGNVRDEASYTEVLRSLAPVDHLIYSGVDKIIRGAIADADLEDAKHYFGVKFWGSAMTGKSKCKVMSTVTDIVCSCSTLTIAALVVSKYDIIKPGGSLTLTSGTGAMKPGLTASIGGSLNAGLFTMTQGLANELTEKKIRVNCAYCEWPRLTIADVANSELGVVPGMVITELWDKMGQSKDQQKENFAKSAKNLPVGFVATPEDVSPLSVFQSCCQVRC